MISNKLNFLKLLLCVFEQLSGLKINFHKSELFCFGQAKECEDQYTQLFGCGVGSFPFRYLGIPIHYRKLMNKEWKGVEDRFEKKLSCWKGRLLSSGGRLTLINSVLTSLPMFMMSFFEIPKGVVKRLDFYRSRFFWQCDEQKRKYRLAKWDILCRPRDQGGLGIENFEIKNICLLSKWLDKILSGEELWVELLRNKYLYASSLSQVRMRAYDSSFWKGLLRIRQFFFPHISFSVNCGANVCFWKIHGLVTLLLDVSFHLFIGLLLTIRLRLLKCWGRILLILHFVEQLLGIVWWIGWSCVINSSL